MKAFDLINFGHPLTLHFNYSIYFKKLEKCQFLALILLYSDSDFNYFV